MGVGDFLKEYVITMPPDAKNPMTYRVADSWLYGWYCGWSFHVKQNHVSQDVFRAEVRRYAPRATLHDRGQKEWDGIRFEGPQSPFKRVGS